MLTCVHSHRLCCLYPLLRDAAWADTFKVHPVFVCLPRSLTTCYVLAPQSYDEFMSLAERGNMRNIHEYLPDLAEGVEEGEDNFYGAMIDAGQDIDEPGFMFGKCVFKDLSKSTVQLWK